MTRMTRRDAVRALAVAPAIMPFAGVPGMLEGVAPLSMRTGRLGRPGDRVAGSPGRPILIAYSTQEGQAQKVAEFAANVIGEAGRSVLLADLEHADCGTNPADAASVLVAASIHMGRYHEELHAFIERHQQGLAGVPTALLSVCLSAATPARNSEAEHYIAELESSTGWIPDLAEPIAGALRYSRYGFLKRQMMKRIAADGGLPTDASQDHEFTNWDQVRRITLDLVARVPAPERR